MIKWKTKNDKRKEKNIKTEESVNENAVEFIGETGN
jgi:hypothetical protein